MVLETNECIQHLLPPPEPPVEKRFLYRSQHDPTALPSYSQIGLQGLNLLAMNTSGEDRSAPFSIGTHCLKGPYHTFGRPRNDQRVHNPITRNSNGTVSPQMNLSNAHRVPNSEKWKETYTELIEGAKDRRIQSLPALRHHKSTHTREERKPPVPLRMEEPIFGLRSEKNYIASNKKECVMTLKKPLRCSSQSPIHRADYGQVPQYLRDIQKRLKDEKQYLQQLKSNAEEMKKTEVPPFLHVIDAKEREEMVEALKVRLEEKQKAYFALPFTLDTSKAIQRKEGMEKEIQMIENALNELQKEVVVVYMTHNAYQANIAREEALKRAQKIAVAQRISHTNSSTTREECVGTPNH